MNHGTLTGAEADVESPRGPPLIYKRQDCYCELENLTLIPLDQRLIAADLLSEEELFWLNTYHKETYDNLEKYFPDAEEKKRLKWMCRPMLKSVEQGKKSKRKLDELSLDDSPKRRKLA